MMKLRELLFRVVRARGKGKWFLQDWTRWAVSFSCWTISPVFCGFPYLIWNSLSGHRLSNQAMCEETTRPALEHSECRTMLQIYCGCISLLSFLIILYMICINLLLFLHTCTCSSLLPFDFCVKLPHVRQLRSATGADGTLVDLAYWEQCWLQALIFYTSKLKILRI